MVAKRIKIIFFTFLILGILFFASLYFGLAQHFLIRQQISRLSGSEREVAEKEFYAKNKPDYIFAGTIAKINRRDEDGVWVWSNQGLKYFQTDKYTFYSYYDICDARTKTLEGKYEINDESREITADIEQWSDRAKTGDFVQLFVARAGNGGQVGNLREIYTYSQPIFLPLELGRLCTN